jgi:hydroxyacylglutathione hydrolase
MILEQFLLAVNETNSYIIACSRSHEAVIIDPGEWNDQLAAFLTEHNLELKWVLLTHGHSDHTAGLKEITGKVKIPVFGHAANPFVTKAVIDGEMITIGELKIKAIETPGHTQDSITYVVGNEVFCGDLLFAGSVGGTPDQASFEQEIRSIKEKVIVLGDDIILHPGHGPASTVQIERIFNPFLMP